ncbi:MAG: hypothetical protein ONB06_12260 [candidate division KSB1 bacterium]|nr:hypothetical protein [candidate division KSB1 bacterium]
MLLHMEKCIPVTVVSHNVGAKGQMFVRFQPQGVQIYLSLSDGNYGARSSGGFLWTLTQELLPQLPTQARLMMSHVLALKREKQLDFISIEEVVWIEREEEHEWSQPHFLLRCDLQGRCYEASGVEDFDEVLRQLAAQLPGQLQVCHFCHFADFQPIGGEDLRHGWRCFRDVPPEKWESYRRWFPADVYERAIKQVDAFHWCPSFRPRREIEEDAQFTT